MSTITASTPPGMRRSLFSASAAEDAVSTFRPAFLQIFRRQHLNEGLVLDHQDAGGRRLAHR